MKVLTTLLGVAAMTLVAAARPSVAYAGWGWGYVWADQPTAASYVPDLSYQYNTSGATNTISRSRVGTYTVEFPHLGGTAAGTFHVTAYGSGAEHCKVLNARLSGSTLRLNVRCFSGGALVDTRFTASFTDWSSSPGAPQPMAYVWADQSTATSYTPRLSNQYNSSGAANTISRSGVGAYTVELPNLGAAAGHVQVTAFGSGSERCKVVNWGPSGSTQQVNVRCFTSDGNPVDAMYTMTYAQDASIISNWGEPGTFAGYAWANDRSAPSYTPNSSYQYNSSGATNTISRSGVGAYTIELPNLGATADAVSTVHVTAYGPGSEHCKVVNWVPNGSAQQVNVRCFTAAGQAADARYTVTFSGDLP